MIVLPSAGSLSDSQVFDNQGLLVGQVDGVYLDEETELPVWISISRPASDSSLAPLAGALISSESIRLPYSKAVIEAAPVIGLDFELTAETESLLSEYYDQAQLGPTKPGNGIPDSAA